MKSSLHLIALVVAGSFLPAGCDKESPSAPVGQPDWVPSLENFAKFPYSKELILADHSAQHHFSLDVRSHDPRLLESVEAGDFEVVVLPPDGAGTVAESDGRAGGSDAGHDERSTTASAPRGAPPLFLKLHYLDGEEPARMTFHARRLPVSEYAMVVNAGHYKSIVLRRPNATRWSYVTFYHHHGDWNLHVLYQGSFYRCTYAYDCYPNHSIPTWRTTYGDEQIEFREDCYGRCP